MKASLDARLCYLVCKKTQVKATRLWITTCASLSPRPEREDPLDQEVASHSSILAWEIPWTEESGGLQSVGSQRDGHD